MGITILLAEHPSFLPSLYFSVYSFAVSSLSKVQYVIIVMLCDLYFAKQT
jgi:hypothetical protein